MEQPRLAQGFTKTFLHSPPPAANYNSCFRHNQCTIPGDGMLKKAGVLPEIGLKVYENQILNPFVLRGFRR